MDLERGRGIPFGVGIGIVDGDSDALLCGRGHGVDQRVDGRLTAGHWGRGRDGQQWTTQDLSPAQRVVVTKMLVGDDALSGLPVRLCSGC